MEFLIIKQKIKKSKLNCYYAGPQQLEKMNTGKIGKINHLKQARDESNIRPLLGTVTDKLNKADITVKEAYGIKHDKDEINVWNQKLMKNVIEKKAEHNHFLKLKRSFTKQNSLAAGVGTPIS